MRLIIIALRKKLIAIRKGSIRMETITEIPVRYSETDAMGVVYHANYLVYLEVGRTEFLEAIGYPYKGFEDAGYMSPVLTCQLEYGAPFRYGDVIEVHTQVTKVTAVRTEYTCRMYLKGEDPAVVKPHFTAVTTHCLVTKGDFKAVSQKRAFPGLYDAYVRAIESNNEDTTK